MALQANPAHPGRALYSILRYWRSSGLQGLDIPEMVDEEDHERELLNRQEQLKALKESCSSCTKCELSKDRQKVISGEGPLNAPIFFIGTHPLLDKEGEDPLSPEVGGLMERMFEKMGYQRHQLYLTHGVRCTTPSDRPPSPTELGLCRPWLDEEIHLVQPKVIVTLGTVATQHLLQLQAPITKLRGRWHVHHDIPVMPTYHPLYLLKKPIAKKDVWSDMQAVLKLLQSKSQGTSCHS